MGLRTVFSGVAGLGLALALVPLGCGGAQDDYTVIEHPSVAAEAGRPQADELPEEIRRPLITCIQQHAGSWSGRSFAVRYDAKANQDGVMQEVTLRSTTLPDGGLEGCLRQVIATMTMPEQALRKRSSGPFSGGERMMRERRGPLGDSESSNPLVLLGPIIVEAVSVEVIIEVSVGIIAAIGTILQPKKDPKEECLDRYVECMDTYFAGKDGPVKGTSRCAWCQKVCNDNNGVWPLTVSATVGTRSCQYPGWVRP